MTEEDGWEEVRKCAIASNTSPAIVIAHAKANRIDPRTVIDRYYRAWDVRNEFPHLTSLPFGYFAATPPGFFDVRALFQRERPIWWVDILRSPYRIDDVEHFTDPRLDGAVAYLLDHARELLNAAVSAHLAPADVENPEEWMRQTSLWSALIDEVDRRKNGDGRSPILAMRESDE